MGSAERLSPELVSAWRGLRRDRSFAVVAIGTLALGIAAATMMFALIRGVLLRPLPVREQDRVIVAWKELRSSGFAHYPFGGPDVEAAAEGSQLLESGAGVTSNGAFPWIAVEDGAADYVNGALVTGRFFEVLGTGPILGRALSQTDDVDGAEHVVVISNGLWRRRYGASPGALGRSIAFGGIPFRIVGVVPDLDYPRGAEAWRTVRSVPAGGTFGDAARYEVDLIARLRPAVTIEQAASELQAMVPRLAATAPPDHPRDLVPVVRSLEDVIVGDVRGAMLALFGAVTLVLLIASANAAILFLMRGEARRQELALRAALGATRIRLMILLLAESVLLALAAGVAGLALASASLEPLLRIIPDGLPRVASVHIDAQVILFAAGTALLTALAAGLAPAVLSAPATVAWLLRSGAHGSGGHTRRRVLVAAQLALAVVIVATAGLLTRSVMKLQSVELGLAGDRLVLVDLTLPPAKLLDRARHAQFLEQVIARLEVLPLIEAATPVNVPPFSGDGGWDVPRFTAAEQSPARAASNPSLNLESVHPNYFETFQIPVVRGRSFSSADRDGAADVAIVSEEVAARTWPGEDPIGKRLKMGGPESQDVWRTIVGVAASTRYRELARPRPTLYLPASQFLMTARIFVVRSGAPLELLASLARDQIRAVDADAQVVGVAAFTQSLDRPLARPRFMAFLLGSFGIAALLLVTIGVYGVMAAYVRQRDREIGIRVALGATTAGVRRLVFVEALRLAGLGAAAGLAAAAGATRFVSGMLFEVDPLDPSTVLGAALLLVMASLLAAYVPMRRAARLDPATLLRSE